MGTIPVLGPLKYILKSNVSLKKSELLEFSRLRKVCARPKYLVNNVPYFSVTAMFQKIFLPFIGKIY